MRLKPPTIKNHPNVKVPGDLLASPPREKVTAKSFDILVTRFGVSIGKAKRLLLQ